MKTWLTDFSARFESGVHDLLWRQWTLLGAAGTVTPGELSSPLDPEALLLITLESARTEPRLFDEVLDWLLKHGSWIDIQRLRNLMREDSASPARLVAAVSAFAGEKEASSKWKRLSAAPAKAPRECEPLFLLPGNEWAARASTINSLFTRYGYRRHPIRTRGMTGPIPVRLAATLRFRLRALFGIGIRAEALTFLIAGRTGNVKEISRAAAYSPLGTLQAVQELAISEMVRIHAKGRRKAYWADAIQWWEFLRIERRTAPGRIISTPEGLAYQDADVKTLRDSKGRVTGGSQGPLVTWTDWRSLFKALTLVLRFLRRPELKDAPAYAGESELGQVLRSVAPFLAGTGSHFHSPADGTPREAGERLLIAVSPPAAPGSDS